MDKKIEKGKVIVADEMISYAEGGVVSKEFVHANAGSLTLFAFDEGQGLNEHSAPFDATVQVLDGEAEIKIDGVPHIVKAGEMIIMPANHPHALFAHKRFKMLLTMIRG
ncbi:MAG: cupin domain-containing protein [Prevotella sp.]|jgi:cupin domain protein